MAVARMLLRVQVVGLVHHLVSDAESYAVPMRSGMSVWWSGRWSSEAWRCRGSRRFQEGQSVSMLQAFASSRAASWRLLLALKGDDRR